ncbi:MAG: tripartite tricarboxylate transporter substrate binding protein [Cutibacterium sp.]|nr:tripartite tricarboxylate transporter substrate binding protein [Cutibacterium sp.]
MPPTPLHRRATCALSLVLTVLATSAHAAYPDKPIRLIVPFPPGGATDVIGRVVASRLGTELGQQVVVDNRAGATGTIGAEAAAKAAPDGYTLLMGTLTTYSTMAILEQGKLRFDLLKDFTPVMVVGAVPLVVVVNPKIPAKNLKDLVDYAKANPDKVSFASAGASSVQRMAAEMMRKEAGVRMLHVPYKGSAPAMTDLVAGQVDMMVETVPAAQNFVKSGRLRALAVTVPTRVAMLPDTPTTQEGGLPSVEISSMFGVLAPAGTPADIIDRLNAAMAKVLSNPDVQSQLLKQGVYTQAPSTSTQSAAQLRGEHARWEKLIKDAAIRSDN